MGEGPRSGLRVNGEEGLEEAGVHLAREGAARPLHEHLVRARVGLGLGLWGYCYGWC